MRRWLVSATLAGVLAVTSPLAGAYGQGVFSTEGNADLIRDLCARLSQQFASSENGKGSTHPSPSKNSPELANITLSDCHDAGLDAPADGESALSSPSDVEEAKGNSQAAHETAASKSDNAAAQAQSIENSNTH